MDKYSIAVYSFAHHGLNSFGFLMRGEGVKSLSQFADMIANHYSLQNPQTADVYHALKALSPTYESIKFDPAAGKIVGAGQ